MDNFIKKIGRRGNGAMLGFVELLKDEDTSDLEKKKFLEVISRNGNTLVSIINDILDISKVEALHLKKINQFLRLIFSLYQQLRLDII